MANAERTLFSSDGWDSLDAYWAAVAARDAAIAAADPVPAPIRRLITTAVRDAGYSRGGALVHLLERVRELTATTVLAHDRDSLYSSTTTTRYDVVDDAGEARAIIVRTAGDPDGVSLDFWPSLAAYRAR